MKIVENLEGRKVTLSAMKVHSDDSQNCARFQLQIIRIRVDWKINITIISLQFRICPNSEGFMLICSGLARPGRASSLARKLQLREFVRSFIRNMV